MLCKWLNMVLCKSHVPFNNHCSKADNNNRMLHENGQQTSNRSIETYISRDNLYIVRLKHALDCGVIYLIPRFISHVINRSRFIHSQACPIPLDPMSLSLTSFVTSWQRLYQ